jgi:hypothetical protein
LLPNKKTINYSTALGILFSILLILFIVFYAANNPLTFLNIPGLVIVIAGTIAATRVLHLLSSLGLQASRLRAVSYGDTQPIADNATEQGREQNRRVSLVIKVSDTVD